VQIIDSSGLEQQQKQELLEGAILASRAIAAKSGGNIKFPDHYCCSERHKQSGRKH
jgi:hypothetical protein